MGYTISDIFIELIRHKQSLSLASSIYNGCLSASVSTAMGICTGAIWDFTNCVRSLRLYRRDRHLSNYNFDLEPNISVGGMHYDDGMQSKLSEKNTAHDKRIEYKAVNLITTTYMVHPIMDVYFHCIFALHQVSSTIRSTEIYDGSTILIQVDLGVEFNMLHFETNNAYALRHINFPIVMGMTVKFVSWRLQHNRCISMTPWTTQMCY